MARTLKRTAAFAALGSALSVRALAAALGWASGSPRCPG